MESVKSHTFAREVSREIRKLDAVVTVVIYCLVLLLVRTLYESLVHISTLSLAEIIAASAFLLAVSTVMFKRLAAKSVRKITESSAKLNTLLTFIGEIRGEIYPDLLLEKILRSAIDMTGAAGGAIHTIEGEHLVCKIAAGKGLEQLRGSSRPAMGGISGQVIKTARVVRMRSGEAGPDGRCVSIEHNGPPADSLLCAPMVVNSRVIGIIELFTDRETGFCDEDEALIAYCADQAAVSLEHAQFREDRLNFETHIYEILLQAMDDHLPVKREHAEKVAKYSHLIAKAINLPFERERKLHIASMLHDIGFIKISPAMEMTRENFQLHCVLGYNMVRPIAFYSDVAPIILHHHERFDGSGYPGRLKGEAIPLESRIIAIAEAYDAMTRASSYKKTLNLSEALRELQQNAGTQFDPELVKVFINLVYRERLYPADTDRAMFEDHAHFPEGHATGDRYPDAV